MEAKDKSAITSHCQPALAKPRQKEKWGAFWAPHYTDSLLTSAALRDC